MGNYGPMMSINWYIMHTLKNPFEFVAANISWIYILNEL